MPHWCMTAKMVVSQGGNVDDGWVASVKAVESAGGRGVDVGKAMRVVMERLPESKGMEVRQAEGTIGGSKCEGWWW